MRTSAAGQEFIREHEGVVRTAYLDPVGVPTIGIGATNASKTATQYLASIGVKDGKIVPGKTTLTPEQAVKLFDAMLRAEYEPYVTRDMPAGTQQHQFDAATSAVYNLGPKFMTWQAVKLWKQGNISAAAAYWRSHYNTASGKKLPGLVRRRREEADMFQYGTYPATVAEGAERIAAPIPEGVPRKSTPVAPAKPDPVVKEAQEALGVTPDGWMGPKTRAAIIAYQKQHPHLEADGVLGPATLSQLRRDAIALREAGTKVIPTVTAVGGASWVTGLPWGWIVAGVAVCAVAYLAYRYRDVWTRRWAAIRGVS